MKMFKVKCCGKRRGLINGILVCGSCDLLPMGENKARDVPANIIEWNIVEGSD